MKIMQYHVIGLVFLLSSAQMHATIYAAAKLVKNGRTVYLLSDVEGESNDSFDQRCAILNKAYCSDTVLIARDPSDIRRVIDSIPQEHKAHFQTLQAGIEEVADQFKAVRPGILTLAYTRNLGVVNMNYETVVFNAALPFEGAKVVLNDAIAQLRDQSSKLSDAERKEFWQHVVAMNTLKDQPKQADDRKKLKHLVARIEQLSSLKSVRLACDLNRDAMICSTPEDIAYVAEHLLKDGWTGDISGVTKFNNLCSQAFAAQAIKLIEKKERKAQDFTKLQAALKKMKKKSSQQKLLDAFNKRWASESSDPIAYKNEIALKHSQGPIDLSAFLATEQQAEAPISEPSCSSDVQGVEQQEESSSFNISSLVSVDAYARMHHAIEVQQRTDISVLQPEEKAALARQVSNDLLPILKLNNENFINTYEHELAYMQMHAAEIAAYFYAHAGDEKRECTSLVNALAAAHNNNLFITSAHGIQFPYHTSATIQRLARLMKKPEHKEYVAHWMASSDFDATEQTNFFAELHRYADAYQR